MVTISYTKAGALTSTDYSRPIKSRALDWPHGRSRSAGGVFVADIYRSIEAEIPRLRRYARALARDVAAADDLVQDCLARALGKLHLARGYGSAGLAIHHPAQSVREPGAARCTRGRGGRSERDRADADPSAASGKAAGIA